MLRPSRRDAMRGIGAGAAGLLVPCVPSLDRSRPRRVAGRSRTPARSDLLELAQRLRAAGRADARSLAVEAAAAGADERTLLGAIFLAGVFDVRPEHVGGKLHCVLAVESCLQHAAGAPEHAWSFVFWNLEELKDSQERDEREGGWELPVRPEVRFASAGEARAELEAAMSAWDPERADRAITGLVALADRATVFDALWPFAARSLVDVGHKILYAAQVHRVLGRIGWRYAEPALRSLVRALLHVDADGDRMVGLWESTEGCVEELPEAWERGGQKHRASRELLETLRTASPEEGQRAAIDAYADGLAASTVAGGLRLAAAEIFLRRPSSRPAHRGAALLPAHAVTELEALHHAMRWAREPRTRRLLAVHAAGWVPAVRLAMIEREVYRADGPELLDSALVEGPRPSIDDVFREPSPATARAAMLGLPDGWLRFLHAARQRLARKGTDAHQFKYLASLGRELTHAHPLWRTALLAPALPYVAVDSDPDREGEERARLALRRAGVLP